MHKKINNLVMQLFLMRHGEAEPTFHDDAQRSLTTQGFIESQKTGVWLKENIHNIEYALVSPFKRAQQTFEMVQSIVEIDNFEICADITPSGKAEQVHDYVYALAHEKSVESLIIVSHMPLVSYLLDEFCGKLQSLIFATASVACLDFDIEQNKATLKQVYLP
ncbi:phosphohistidine phosphatase SixA [Planctobacterium marinum]|uniref:phosphohistidine phosphatase SixA n=1 Tax=Planctobacterium marinum TaxID=1631968 RepID=UPI001E32FEB2|nr:phosphohistidine phosphatase SixA [Planctobacterium marinum]MCC2604517.1 phosphohistidine phosphatase SixA [Planctobacterium marinum]